ncbi:MAG: hypothetical protein QG608_3072 [Actinomycetota bacterium]|nr:hypothetical protein [Actinomycetota bacterium]
MFIRQCSAGPIGLVRPTGENPFRGRSADFLGEACVFLAPGGRRGRGHVGWGMRTGNSTFVWGATEGPVRPIDGLTAPAGRKRAWHLTGSRKAMVESFRNGGGVNLGTGYYTTCTCGSVVGPDPVGAARRVAVVEHSRYGLLRATCVDDVHSILCAYGTCGLPAPSGRWHPTAWYSGIRWGRQVL